ncbi:MAG TPA: DmsC/YnfH family molybdoenzyme membrane anchor subunit [Rhodocyclaceae bacterium]|nr:DmsC/YnfH family molybdoenzyme membrane anchor subunit [Rhodocyclaceae bacterium]
MRPAFSVIFLTTLIGAGQGLFLALFTVESYAAFGLLPSQDDGFYAAGTGLAMVFLAAGLAASFFHLGRPERAWRSATRWRTSWLSREVIALPAFMAVAALYGAAHLAGFNPALAELPGGIPVNVTAVLGSAGTVLAFALFLCTGMIYASLRFLREWHSPLTVINYVLLGGASGFMLATAYAALAAPALVAFLAAWTAILTGLALVSRSAALFRNRRLKPKSTPQSAIGVKHPRIVQITQGFLGGSFNTREFDCGRPASFRRGIQWLFLTAVFPVALAIMAAGLSAGSVAMLAAAFAVQYLGLLAERWHFFAEARHPQNLYYQAAA